jgi:hypothetical protein
MALPFRVRLIVIGEYRHPPITARRLSPESLGGRRRLCTPLPIAKPSFQVSNRDDDNFVRQGTVYDFIGKSLHQHTACSAIGRLPAYFGLRLNEGCCINDGIKEFPTQPNCKKRAMRC